MLTDLPFLGTGYPDSDVYNRIHHFPWPDHHPPPFALVPLIMASMRNWIKGEENKAKGRVAVVHCKAGKGRSGTVTCSYLISEEGWDLEKAKQRFTERRMKPGFGAGISIPSQVRWLGYVDRWHKHGKTYMERPVEVLELHVWGLRNGVKIAVEGFVEEGKVIKSFHTFSREERDIVRGSIVKDTGFADVALEAMGKGKKKSTMLEPSPVPKSQADGTDGGPKPERDNIDRMDSDLLNDNGGDVIFRPASRVVLPTSDVNIDFERRNRSKYGGFTMVTSVAHVWFNSYFEGQGPEKNGKPEESGVFEIEWDAMDGIKGSSRKGTRAFDKIAVLWKAVESEASSPVIIHEPPEGQEVEKVRPADWRGNDEHSDDFEKKLGLRTATSESAAVSRASSYKSTTNNNHEDKDVPDESEGVKPHLPDEVGHNAQTDGSTERLPETQSVEDLPGEKPQDRHHLGLGSIHRTKKEDTVS